MYDGHCGDQASTHLQETLHYAICCHPLYQTDIERAIIETCIQTGRTDDGDDVCTDGDGYGDTMRRMLMLI